MSTLETLTGRSHLSYSSMTSWMDCGERYRLERVLNAPQGNAWWFLAGDTIHKASEDLDLDNVTDVDEADTYWRSHWTENVARIEDLTTVKAGGRSSKEWPNKENKDYWDKMGPVYVANWIKWRSQAFHDGWQWFLLPNGEPAIEVPVEIDFDNVLVKGYIDRVMVNPNGEVVVVDLKSGSRVPASTLQLGTYALGVKRKFDVTATLGSYWMARTGQLTEPASLLHYTPEIVGGWYGSAKKAIEAEVFIPHVGPFCGSCAVSPYCTAVGGDPAPLTKLKKMAEDNANPPF